MGISLQDMVRRCQVLLLLCCFQQALLSPSASPESASAADTSDNTDHNLSWLSSLLGSSRRDLRSDKDKHFWATRGKRSADPEDFWAIRGKKQSIKPNGFFQAMESRSNAPSKRGLKPNGLFGAIKREGMKPNGLFGAYKRPSLKPNGLDEDYFDEDEIEEML